MNQIQPVKPRIYESSKSTNGAMLTASFVQQCVSFLAYNMFPFGRLYPVGDIWCVDKIASQLYRDMVC